MNCVRDDLVMVVRDLSGNMPWSLGKIFNVRKHVVRNNGDYWTIDPPQFGPDGVKYDHARDDVLRPIRPGDGEDEMLRIVGKPQEVAA